MSISSSGLQDVVRSRRANAILAWLLIGFLLLTAGASLLEGDLLWAGFTLVVAVLAVVPAVAFRAPTAMLPWEVLLIASFPVIGRAFLAGVTLAGVTLTGRLSTYFAVAAVALIVAVELDVFTPVRMNQTFAVIFVGVATMATAGLWAEVRWALDVLFGTTFLLDGRPEHAIERALMLDFVAATVVGVGIGVIFEFYVRRRARAGERLPEELEAA